MSEGAARALRILHAPTDTGGQPTGLSRAERRLGADSTVAAFRRSPFLYDVDIDLKLERHIKPMRLVRKVQFAAANLTRYDVFHFNFGATLLPRLGPIAVDLPLLKALGRRVFMTYQGDDVRPSPAESRSAARRKQARVAYHARFCDRVFCVNPDLIRGAPHAEFLPYASVDPRAVQVAEPRPDDRITILHAPTNRAVKGTEHVIAALEQLRDRHDFDFILVENQPHDHAMELYRRADLVIDQLKVGWYGGFAVELMAMGKPVVCYLRDEDVALIPPAMAADLPLVRATTATIAHVLDDLLSHRENLPAIGQRSRAFVERWHDPLEIARRMLAIYCEPARPFWTAEELAHGGADSSPG